MSRLKYVLSNMIRKETAICRLCLQPVSNYICIDCLFEDIQSWLIQKNQQKLISPLGEQHERIRAFLSQDNNFTTCVHCKETINETACPCCYLFEIYSLLKMIDPNLAKDFEKYFNFDFLHHQSFGQFEFLESLYKEIISKINFEPIIITDSQIKSDISFCDDCEQDSADLKESNGLWLCESCRDNL